MCFESCYQNGRPYLLAIYGPGSKSGFKKIQEYVIHIFIGKQLEGYLSLHYYVMLLLSNCWSIRAII